MPGHIGDRDSRTGTEGLQAKRVELHKTNHFVRCLYAVNDTPESCDSDQLHRILEADIDKRIRENSMEAPEWPEARVAVGAIGAPPPGYAHGALTVQKKTYS